MRFRSLAFAVFAVILFTPDPARALGPDEAAPPPSPIVDTSEPEADMERVPDHRGLGAGLGLFAVSYGWCAAMSGVYKYTDGRRATDMAIPIVGPYLAILRKSSVDGNTMLGGRLIGNGDGDGLGAGLKVMGGIYLFTYEVLAMLAAPVAQTFGLASALSSLGRTRLVRRERATLTVAPLAVRSGAGVALSLTSW